MSSEAGEPKGKGKGKGKGPPPPVGLKKPPPSGVQGGFARNMNKGAEDRTYAGKEEALVFLWLAARSQLADGSLDPEVFGKHIVGVAADRQRGEYLQTQEKLFHTATFLEAFSVYVQFKSEKVEKVVTKLGDGRGQETETEIKITKRTAEDAIIELSSHSPLGEEMMAGAEAWLAANTGDGDMEASARAWFNTHYTFEPNVKPSAKTLSKEEMEEREKLRRQRDLEQAEKKRQCYAHWQTLMPARITGVPWSTCRQVMHVGGGTGGCLMVELEADQVICVKPQGSYAVAEFVAERVLKALSVPVASCRLVHWKGAELPIIRQHLIGAPTMIEGQESNVKSILKGLTTGWGVEFVGALEFVPGHGLVGQEAKDALAGEGAAQIYEGLGRICAADALINNLDRVPLPLWNNDGNLSNVIVRGGREVIAIDQQTNGVVEGPAQDAYVARLRELVADCRAGARSKAAQTVRQALMENAGTEAPDEAMDAMMASLRRTFEHVAELWNAGTLQEAIAQAQFEATVSFEVALTDLGQTRTDAMIEFVRRTAAEVAAAVAETAE